MKQLDLSIPYKKVMKIETSMAKETLKQSDALGGICIPLYLVQDMFVWFTFDNTYFLEATPSGMNTLHGAVLAVYQSKSLDKSPIVPPMKLDRSSKLQTLCDTFDIALPKTRTWKDEIGMQT